MLPLVSKTSFCENVVNAADILRCQASILLSGILASGPAEEKNGIHQGDESSPYLLIIIADVPHRFDRPRRS